MSQGPARYPLHGSFRPLADGRVQAIVSCKLTEDFERLPLPQICQKIDHSYLNQRRSFNGQRLDEAFPHSCPVRKSVERIYSCQPDVDIRVRAECPCERIQNLGVRLVELLAPLLALAW